MDILGALVSSVAKKHLNDLNLPMEAAAVQWSPIAITLRYISKPTTVQMKEANLERERHTQSTLQLLVPWKDRTNAHPALVSASP